LYWVLSSGAAAFVLVALFAAQLIHADSVARVYRQLYVRDELSFYPPPSGPARSYYLSRLNARASAAYPSSLSVDGAERILRGRGGEILEQTALIYLAWPFATFMTLMVFRASMRRAKVRPIHVTRCIIYGGNAALCTGVLASTLISLISDRFAIDSHRRAPPMMIVAAAVGIAAFFHLGCAYRRYLKFDRPWATAAASQVIVWLLFSVLAVSWVPVDEWVDIRPPKSLSTSDAASFVTIAYAAPIPNASARRGSYRSDEGLL
jgi:hypothetical protein